MRYVETRASKRAVPACRRTTHGRTPIERTVLYDERQAFIVRNREPRGVEITLRLPFEHAVGGAA